MRAGGFGSLLFCPGAKALLLEKRQTPSTLCAFSVNVLLADAMPDLVVFGELAPWAGDLCGLAEGDGVEVAEDLEGEFVGEGDEEVDLELFGDLAGHGGELGKAALGHDALEHEVAVAGGGGGEETPYVGDGLAIVWGESVQFLGREG